MPVVVVTWFTALPAVQVTELTVLPAMVVTPVYVPETVAIAWNGGRRGRKCTRAEPTRESVTRAKVALGCALPILEESSSRAIHGACRCIFPETGTT